MRFLFLFVSLFAFAFYQAQNNARLFSSDGRVFKVTMDDKAVNNSAQAEVLVENITKDTLYLKVTFENENAQGITIYLLEKGKQTKGREFDYEIRSDKGKIHVRFSGVYDIIRLPEPLVPVKPIIDTSAKYKNTRLAHFCEMKDGKPVYYNNIPKTVNCTTSMPGDHMNYINLLMSKAEVPDEKTAIAENVVRNNCVSVQQLTVLLGYVDYELEKLNLVKLAYQHIADKNNQNNLQKSFRFESSIAELNSFLTSAQKSNSANTACTMAAEPKVIEDFAAGLGVQPNDAQRMEVFKKSYASHCYSTAQVTLVLQKFIHDREKVQAAKLLYYYCTEKEKYGTVSSSFSYKDSSAELSDFINKQNN